VRDNVEYGLRVRRVPRGERGARVDAALALLGLRALADAPVTTLSGGEARRVALARALVLEPECLFLDEPASDLDVSAHRQLLEDLERAVRRSSRAVLLVTHVASEAFALGDRIAVMERGRITQEGTPEEIFETPATAFAASFTGAEFLLRGRVTRSENGSVWVELEGEAGRGIHVEARGRAPVGAVVRVAYRPEDVVVATADAPPRTSARNRFEMQITALRPLGSFVRLRLAAPSLGLVAVVTRNAVEELRLAVGTRVLAQLKATALHAFESV
jgi:molybdopterin-binding protein